MTPPDQPQPPAGQSLGDRVRSLRLGDREKPPPPRSLYLPWLLVVVLLFVCAAFGYRAYRVGSYDPEAAERREAKGPAPKADGKALPAAPSKPAVSAGEVVLQSKGYVVPISLIQVSPRVGGQLIHIHEHFEEGRLFKEGEVLARIDPREYQYERDQAEAAWLAAKNRYDELTKTRSEELKQAAADLEEVRNNVHQMKLELDRNQRLVRGSAVAQRELEQAQYGYQAMAARQRRMESALKMLREGRLDLRIEAARQEAKQAEEAYKKAVMRFEWATIRAPITGIILSKKAELYNLVNPSAFSSGISASLCEMADLTRLEVDLSIQERDIALIKQNQVCQVMPEAYQNDKEFLSKHPQGYVGYVSRLMPMADRAKGAVPVRVRVKGLTQDEAGRFLRPEMGALVSFKNEIDPRPLPAAK